MKRLAAIVLLSACGVGAAKAGDLAEAKNNFHRWLGVGYSDGYHAWKCYRPGGPCHPCECVPYSPRHPRNPSRLVGQAYFHAAGCCPHEGWGHETIDDSTSPMTVHEEVVDPQPIESASPKGTH